MKSEVDNRRPAGTKFTHMRSKNFKEDFFRKREHLLENNILVTKILKAKVSVEFLTFSLTTKSKHQLIKRHRKIRAKVV